MKLGKKPYVQSKKDLLYRNYRGTNLPPIPASFGHQNLVSNWGMLGNDTVGDCVIAGADHAIMLWTAEGTGAPVAFTTANALADYSAITGYNPNDPNSNQGTDIRTALQYQQTTGMINAPGKRHKIGAFLALDQTNFNEVLEALYLFSVVKIGIMLPESAQQQFANGQPWTVVAGSPIEGGHDVELTGFDGTWLKLVTWGVGWEMSVEFFKAYCDEAWVALSEEFLNGKGVSPEGFDLTQLQADLTAIADTPKSYALDIAAGQTQVELGNEVTITVTATANGAGISDQNIVIKTQLADGSYLPDDKVSTDGYGQSIVSIGIGVNSAQTAKITANWTTPSGEILVKEVDVTWVGPTPSPILKSLILYYGDADLQIAADLAQNFQCPIVQAAYATTDLLASATTKYQVGGSSAPAGVTLLAGADRFATMKAVLQAAGKD
jgi:hypothetical protein